MKFAYGLLQLRQRVFCLDFNVKLSEYGKQSVWFDLNQLRIDELSTFDWGSRETYERHITTWRTQLHVRHACFVDLHSWREMCFYLFTQLFICSERARLCPSVFQVMFTNSLVVAAAVAAVYWFSNKLTMESIIIVIISYAQRIIVNQPCVTVCKFFFDATPLTWAASSSNFQAQKHTNMFFSIRFP